MNWKILNPLIYIYILYTYLKISKGAMDMKFSQDFENNSSNQHMQKNQSIDVHKLSSV